MTKLSANSEPKKELRQVVVETIGELMVKNKEIVALDADLGAASGWSKLGEIDKNRFINVGIAEANMIGVAAGLSLTGFTPFIHTFAPFATRRVFDQLFLSGGYAQNTLNIYGSDPGFCTGANGGTHTSWEDVALMRCIPGSIVCDAADEAQMAWILREFSQRKGINYVRGNRKAVHKIYEATEEFQLGKGKLLKEGKDILLVAAGQLVFEAMQVAEALENDGYTVAVIDMFTIKPLDKVLLLEQGRTKKYIVTIENHSITGGLGSAVAEILAEQNWPQKLTRIGVSERFGQVGTPQYLQSEFALTTAKIFDRIQTEIFSV